MTITLGPKYNPQRIVVVLDIAVMLLFEQVTWRSRWAGSTIPRGSSGWTLTRSWWRSPGRISVTTWTPGATWPQIFVKISLMLSCCFIVAFSHFLGVEKQNKMKNYIKIRIRLLPVRYYTMWQRTRLWMDPKYFFYLLENHVFLSKRSYRT